MPMKLQDYLTLLLLAAIWGASFVVIKVAVGEMSPFVLVFGRNLSAAAALLVLLWVSKVPLSTLRRHWRTGLVIAVLNAALPYVLISFGEKYIDSSLAGILNATAPLWTALLAPMWLEADRLGWKQVAGLALGFAGVVILARPTGGIFSSSMLGVLMVVTATLSYAFASHFAKRHFNETPAQVPAFLQSVGAAVLLFPLALATWPSHTISMVAFGGMIWLGLGATGLAMVLSFRLIKRVGASRTIVVTYLIPPLALAWGVGILHEHVGIEVVAALGLILSGVFLITAPGAPRVTRLGVDEAVIEV